MATHWVCTYCIATRGLRGADLDQWPSSDDHDAQAHHIESAHHIPVRREGESEADTMIRFQREQPEAGGPMCRCPSCRRDPRTTLVDRLRAPR